ncbi:protein transporter [Martiniozyma asiatica (nom. inval.)]|nr:protein transporter [Martiniozyma asiatica]
MSNIDISVLNNLDESSRQEVAQFVQQETSKAKIQNSVTQFTDMCFKRCVTSINGPQLDSTEEKCMNECLNKFLDTNIKVVGILQSLQK